MKMLIGLGNPGPQYTRTRHNVGFMVIDRLIAAHAANTPVKGRFQALTVEATFEPASGDRSRDEKVVFMKPTTFMNLSGRSVGEAVRFFKLDASTDILVITDDLYLPVGAVRMRPAGGTGGHNGLESIEQALGTNAYPRLRVGVGVPGSASEDAGSDRGTVGEKGGSKGGGKPEFMDQADYVLSRFSADEEPLLAAGISKAAEACEHFVRLPLDKAMNKANAGVQRPNRPRPPEERKA